MLTEKILIINKSGLHVRPAGVLAKECLKFKCETTVKFKNTEYNAKSVLGILSSAIKYGDEIDLICSGEDEHKAMDSISSVIRAGLGE